MINHVKRISKHAIKKAKLYGSRNEREAVLDIMNVVLNGVRVETPNGDAFVLKPYAVGVEEDDSGLLAVTTFYQLRAGFAKGLGVTGPGRTVPALRHKNQIAARRELDLKFHRKKEKRRRGIAG